MFPRKTTSRKKSTKKTRVNPRALTPVTKQKIAVLAKKGLTLRKIASRLKVSLSTAQRYA